MLLAWPRVDARERRGPSEVDEARGRSLFGGGWWCSGEAAKVENWVSTLFYFLADERTQAETADPEVTETPIRTRSPSVGAGLASSWTSTSRVRLVEVGSKRGTYPLVGSD